MALDHVHASTKWGTDGPLLRVAEMLGVAPVHAYGLVTALAGYCLERHRTGVVRDLSAETIESAVGWDGEPGHFAAVVTDNYVDHKGVLRGWEQTAWPVLKERLANNARVNKYRQSLKEKQDRQADEFIKGAGGNGAAPLHSPNAASPAAAPDATRARAQPPDAAAAPPTAARPTSPDHQSAHSSAPGLSVTRDARSIRDVTRDSTGTSDATVENNGIYPTPPRLGMTDVENVTRDNVTRDVTVTSVTGDVTRDASRAVVQDLEQDQKQDQVRDQEQDQNQKRRSRSFDREEQQEQGQGQRSIRATTPNTATISVASPVTKVYQRMMELTAALIGSPDADSASLLDDARAGRAYDEVKRFLYKFYDNAPQSRLVEILTEMLLALSPSGIVTPSGVRLANVSPDALRYAIVETTEHPPRVFASAWPFAMRKLESGKGNLALGGDGLTGTERASRRHHAEDARIAPEVKRLVDSVGGSIGRRPVTTKADEQRTALRWMAGSAAVRSELAEACEATFRGWRQDIPGLDVAKENWVRAEALKRWRAAGRPLPMPPVRHQ